MTDQYLFVYGTLRSDCGAAFSEVMRGQFTLLGKATTQGRLYNLGHYPGLTLSASNEDLVTGELYRLTGSATAMALLDQYEESAMSADSGAEYYRARQSVTLAGGSTFKAWVYIYNWPVAEEDRIASGDYAAK
jgi:gamma-glutamylcyclotransferase (GGCT)/AIG2-like uncharacterized protein YtfP